MPNARSVLIVAPAPPPYGGMALQGQELIRCLCQEGVDVRFLPTNPPLKIVSGFKGVRTVMQTLLFVSALVRELRRTQVVHVLAASYLFFFIRVAPVLVLGRLFGRRVIVNYRGGQAERFFASWGWFARPVLRLGKALVVPSAFLQRVFAAQGFRAEIIPNLIDLSRFEAKKNGHAANGSGPRLLVTRNLESMYNVKMALEAFAAVKKRYPSSKLDIIGTGRQEAELKDWVKRQGLTDIYFHGGVPNEEVPVYLCKSDILLNPSNVDNMPINLLEAFAAEVPVVSTRAGGIPDLVGADQAALLVEPGDPAAMAGRVLELVEHPEKVKSLTAHAKSLCREFTWGCNRERWLGVYFPEETERV